MSYCYEMGAGQRAVVLGRGKWLRWLTRLYLLHNFAVKHREISVLVEVLNIFISLCIKTFIIRSWLTSSWSLTNPKMCRVSQQDGDPGLLMVLVLVFRLVGSIPKKGSWLSLSPKAVRQKEFSPTQPFCSTQAFSWLETALILFIQSTNLNVNFIQQHSYRHPRIMFEQTLGSP
jgi:hypothetical protein